MADDQTMTIPTPTDAGTAGQETATGQPTPAGTQAQATQDQTPVATQHTEDTTVQTKQVGKYKVEVIRDKCISAASCVAIAPGVFELDEEQLAIVISQDGNDDQTKLLAAQSCPTAAIIVTDTETGQQVWPQ